MMDARRLWRTQSLVARRQRAASGLLGRLAHPLWRGVLGGAAGAAIIAAVVDAAGPAEARIWWVGATLCAAIVVVLGAPFRMFWRFDSTLIARLPIGGDALYKVATRRSLIVAGSWLLALLVAAVPLGLASAVSAGDWLRLLFYPLALLVSAGLLAPLSGAIAGAIVVSAKTQELIRDISSGQAAPGVAWLSVIPVLAGAGLAFLGFTATSAPHGGRDLLAGAVAAVGVLHTLGARLARISLSAATREVAALDAVKLAHVERVGPRGLERLWGRLVAGPGAALYDKDVTLLRRRHPGYYILTGFGILALWIVAFAVAEPARTHITLAGLAALAAYIVLTARRLTIPPTEQPRLLAVLPITTATISRAKVANVAWRAVWLAVVGAGPAVLRSPRPLFLAAAALGISAVALIVGGVVARSR